MPDERSVVRRFVVKTAIFSKWTCNAPFGQALVLLAMSALLFLAAMPLPVPVAPPAPRPPRSAALTLVAAPSAPPLAPSGAVSVSTAAPEQGTQRADDGGALLTRALYEPGFARPHAELCPRQGARLRLLILVASAPAAAGARRAVRVTWGHAAARRDLAVGFVLGRPPAALRAALDREDALYGDLIEGRSRDSRSNRTLKAVSMLEWKEAYCPRAPFLLKADDDVFVNVDRLLQFAAGRRRARAVNTVWGALRSRVRPTRTPWHEHFAPPAQFPGAVFPDFVRGSAYLVAADAARRLARAAAAQRYLRLEDVFVTGVLAARLGVRREQPHGFLRLRPARDACEARRWLAVRLRQRRDQLDLWTMSLDGHVKCRVPPPV